MKGTDFVFALVIAAIFLLPPSLLLIAYHHDEAVTKKAIEACAARGGRYVVGRDFRACMSPDAFK